MAVRKITNPCPAVNDASFRVNTDVKDTLLPTWVKRNHWTMFTKKKKYWLTLNYMVSYQFHEHVQFIFSSKRSNNFSSKMK